MKQICSTASEILSQLDVFLGDLTDEAYSTNHHLLSGASIGEHTRHILDGYLCLMRQADSGTISYDDRERNPLISHQTAYAGEQLQGIRKFLNGLSTDRAVVLEICYHEEAVRITSTLAREMIHNIEHAIHHLAIIKIALKAFHPDIELPPHFGVAPSTLRFREEMGPWNAQAEILST